MDDLARFRLTNVALFAVALAHAVLTWPPRAVVALFVGGAALAGVGEVAVIRLGLLEHELEPQVAGVPVVILLAWPAVVYLSLRLALLLAPPGVAAAALAAVLATATDLATDPDGVERGVWRYPEAAVSTPRYRGVPWWNFAGWLLLVFVVALLGTTAL